MSEAKPIICAACAEVATLPGHVEPHKHMRVEDQHTSRSHDGRSHDGSYDTHYRCLECDTRWVCHTDKWGFNSGFKLGN